MNAAYDKLCEHLTSHSISFWPRSEDLSICTSFWGDVGTYKVFARIDTDENVFQFYSYSPVRVPAGAFVAITETVNRINCRLRVGRFELDCDDGELRYQVGQILPNGSLDDDTIEGVIATTIAMLNIYLPAFICVIYGNELPEEAVKHAWPRGDGSDESQRRDG